MDETYLVKEKLYRGYTIKIYVDDMAENPAKEWDMLTTYACWHRNYDLSNTEEFPNPDDFEEYYQKNKNKLIFAPVYMYDHSGQTIRLSAWNEGELPQGHARFDTFQLGWAFVHYDKVKEWYGWKYMTKRRIERVRKAIESDTDVYDSYIRGDVYGYSIEDSNGDQIDSCAGFYGYDFEKNGLYEQAKPAIDYEILNRLHKHFDKLKAQIKGKAPLAVRETLVLN
jgi:hypothetical protein